uniref:DUF4220 domain-containing protein n=1 Tax=Oryza barthii TaxID=65489 RepID=A0A0D3FT31_9ORYZ
MSYNDTGRRTKRRWKEEEAAQRAIARVQQLWNEWEIQCLVIVSFLLQAFLLFATGFRKRHRSRVLRGLLWLAYLSADSVAVFLLGRLTLQTGDPRHQLTIFWAPFLLLHLGGQETISAFSMEDSALWKRHVLNLLTQSTLAIYVVAKQWRGDRRLLPPMLLIFVCGIGKYAERAWYLRRAGSRAPGSRSIAGHVTGARREFEREVFWYYDKLNCIFVENLQLHFELVLELATRGFQLSLDFLMDVIPAKSLRPETDWNEGLVARIKSSEKRADLVYKLAEVHLSLIYDYLYTKFGGFLGTVLLHCVLLLLRPAIFVLTSIAVSLFVVAQVDQEGTPTHNYYGTDVTISYILLAGAVALEMSSIFMWFKSSYWPYMTISYLKHRDRFRTLRTLLLFTVRLLGRQNKMEWSGMLAQYNMINTCNRENQAGSLEKMVRSIGIDRDYTTHVLVSPEVKNVLLDQLLDIATTSGTPQDLDFGNFHGQWARNGFDLSSEDEAAGQPRSSGGSAAQDALRISAIQHLDFVSSAILWHFVTEICLLAGDEEVASGISMLRRSSEELSNYIIYLIVKCNVMLGSDGHYVVKVARRDVKLFLGMVISRREFVQKVRDGDPNVNLKEFPALDRAHRVSSELFKMNAHDRWRLISLVCVEMICYVAQNCGAGFHAKHLSTGGEFVTHVKMLLFIIGLPLRRHTKEHLFPSEEIEERKFLRRSHPWRRG